MQSVVITGVSRGLGAALAKRFLFAGYIVIGTTTENNFPSDEPNLHVLPLRLEDKASIEHCVGKIEGLVTGINILINNAAILLDLNETKLDTETLQKTLAVNLVGTSHFTELLIPHLSKPSHIINVSSNSGSVTNVSHPRAPAYRISKAGLNMYTRALAERLSPSTIVSAVNPGWMDTDMGRGLSDTTPPTQAGEAADWIFNLASDTVPTGRFWAAGGENPW